MSGIIIDMGAGSLPLSHASLQQGLLDLKPEVDQEIKELAMLIYVCVRI